MARYILTLIFAVVLALTSDAARGASGVSRDVEKEIARLLDDWHAAAARADEAAYFGAFAPDAVFMGTDATERWDVAAFRAYAHPYFAKGKAWSFKATERHITAGADARTAWFDELLETPNLGPCRGSGVVVMLDGRWKIAQYNLSIPIPNDLAKEFVARIAAYSAGTGAAGTTVNVMSFNIRYDNKGDGDDRWELRREKVAAFIRKQAPDAIGLQEALHGQLEYLKEQLPEMAAAGVGRDDGKTRGEYAAILYRKDRWRAAEEGTFWLSDTPEEAGSKSWGNNVVRICTWVRLVPARQAQEEPAEGGGGFYLFNVHLDHQSQPSRERSVVLLLDRIGARAHPAPAVVTGDFNAGETNQAVLGMKGLVPLKELAPDGEQGERTRFRFTDAFRAVHAQETVVGTFNAFRGETRGEKIDYIFVPPGVRVTAAAIHRERPGEGNGRDLSDHFPISATLVLPGVAPAR